MTWIRSTACESNSCIEIDTKGPQVAFRNSNEPQNVVTFSPGAWMEFLGAVEELNERLSTDD